MSKKKHKKTRKTTYRRPLSYSKGDARLTERLPQMRLTAEDYDLLKRARAHRVTRTGRIEPITEFVRQAIRDAADRELGKQHGKT